MITDMMKDFKNAGTKLGLKPHIDSRLYQRHHQGHNDRNQ